MVKVKEIEDCSLRQWNVSISMQIYVNVRLRICGMPCLPTTEPLVIDLTPIYKVLTTNSRLVTCQVEIQRLEYIGWGDI